LVERLRFDTRPDTEFKLSRSLWRTLLGEEVDAEVELRSVYASPFPMTATIDELTAFFAAHAKAGPAG
jgi:hypothetical protein